MLLTYGCEVCDGDFQKDIWVSILVSILSILLTNYRYYIDTYFLWYFPSLAWKLKIHGCYTIMRLVMKWFQQNPVQSSSILLIVQISLSATFGYFLCWKKFLQGCRLNTDQEVIDACNTFFHNLDESEFEKTIFLWGTNAYFQNDGQGETFNLK